MKMAKSRTEFATLEHTSFTLSQINQDASGKQTINRTYWSIRKKINQPVENTSNLILIDPLVTEKSAHQDRRKEQKPVEKFTQLSLFPTSTK
jgi:hypothetical protein